MTPNAKRALMWTGVALVAAAALVFAFVPRPVPVDLHTLERGALRDSIAEEGHTRVHDVFVLSAPVAGRVRRIEAHAGDPVTAHVTILAQIEPSQPAFLDVRGEAQAEAAVQAAESARRLALAEVDEAQAELEFAASEQRRAAELHADGTISRRALEDAERAYKTARAVLATARAALQMRSFELERAKAELVVPGGEGDARPDCACLPLVAPISGRVLRVASASERVVAAGTPLLEVGDPSGLEIVVDLLSADAVRAEPGQRVVIENWGGQEPLDGRVRTVEPLGFTKVSALGIEEQRVNVIIDFVTAHERRRRLGHGYQVDVRIVLWESSDVLTVPLTALFRVGQEWATFVAEGGRAALRRIEVGRNDGLSAEVVSGLAAGERVVLHPSNRVGDGTRIAARG